MLFHLKGITLCLDPLLYKWISYKSPVLKVTPRHKAERERTKSTKHQSLTRTPSATTPRKKSFARGSDVVNYLPVNFDSVLKAGVHYFT